MTLVVARRIGTRIYIVGDTKFTPQSAGGRDGQRHYIGGLKVVLLHPSVAVAFAGNTESARQAIEGIHTRGVNLFNKSEVLEYLLGSHRHSLQQGENAAVEFIAAFILDSSDPELVLVKEGKIEWVDAGYIGNSLAYNSFLHHQERLGGTGPEFAHLGTAMQALKAVISDSAPDLQDVDGFVVGMRHSEDEGFVYSQGIYIEGPAIPVRPGPMAPLHFLGAPEGGNTWQIGSSPGDRLGVLTAYCHTASFGVIYRPALDFEPRLLRNCTIDDLMRESLIEVNQITTLLEQMHLRANAP